MKRIFPFLIFIFFLCVNAFPQTNAANAPFASRIMVEAGKNKITITWKDSEDVDGSYLVYRYKDEINSDNFSRAQLLGEVPGGKQFFIDFPHTTETYFYAVLAKEPTGTIHTLFIPFRNITVRGSAITEVVTSEDIVAAVSGISAAVQEDSVLISFRSTRPDRDLIMYRSTIPIRDRNDLVYSQPLHAISSSESSFKDYPVPGIAYYYALIDASLVKSGEVSFIAGQNSTILPVEIPLGIRVGLPQSGSSRPLPLPLYPISVGVESGERLVQGNIPSEILQQDLSPGTGKVLASLLESVPPLKRYAMDAVVLPRDTVYEKIGSDQYTLKTILDNEFSEERWAESETLLNNFLSVHRSKDVEIRSHFYLGQVYYFQGKYRKAFMEFLLARDTYYSASQPWMYAIFEKLDS